MNITARYVSTDKYGDEPVTVVRFDISVGGESPALTATNLSYPQALALLNGVLGVRSRNAARLLADAQDLIETDPRLPGNEPWSGGEDNGYDVRSASA